MGKARIISEQGEGRYTIEIIEARERAESAKNQAQSRISERRADIVGLESDISAARLAVDRAAGDQADAIVAYRAGNMEIGELSGYTQAVGEAARLRDSLLSQKRSKNMLIASDETLIARVNSLPALRQMQAWCADYTEELSGEVGTAEVPGEIGQVIIKPGFEESNNWTAGDGAMQPALAGTPAGTFYNLAMLPGWQKWRPTFRVATITAIDGDQCAIDLDSASSSQGFGVNAESSYSDVPILYMECNGDAFEEEDRVLVAFAGNVDGPTVVGFESEPKTCCTPEVLGASPDVSTPWDVAKEFGDAIVESSTSRWRIVDNDTGAVFASGGVEKNEDVGGYRLSGLPDGVELERETDGYVGYEARFHSYTQSPQGEPETITFEFYVESPLYASGWWSIRKRTRPNDAPSSPDPATYFPGMGNHSNGILGGGSFHKSLSMETVPGSTVTRELYFIKRATEKASFRLEKGCRGNNGVSWPPVEA